MNKKLKDLLLQDLCVRYPYGVMCKVEHYAGTFVVKDLFNKGNHVCGYFKEFRTSHGFDIEEVKPYLRPMSSMTEEEKAELAKITYHSIGYDEEEGELKSVDFYYDARLDAGAEAWVSALDWLNKKMFAYRTYDGKDMFELGLAIVAPEGMYNDK